MAADYVNRKLSVESQDVYVGVKQFLNIPFSRRSGYTSSITTFLKLHDFESIFPLLLHPVKNIREDTAEALRRIFRSSFGSTLMKTKEVTTWVLKGLSEDIVFLRGLSLDAFEAFQTEADFLYLVKSPLMASLIGCVQSDHVTKMQAAKIIKEGCRKYSSFTEKFLSNTDLLLNYTGPFELAALVAEVATFHPKGLKKYRRRGCFQDLLSRLRVSEDVLMKLATLQLLEDLSTSDLGYLLVTSSHVVKAISPSITDFSYDCTGCLKFVAKIAEQSHVHDKSGTWNQSPELPGVLLGCFRPAAPSNVSIQICDTIGHLLSMPTETLKYKNHGILVAKRMWTTNQQLKEVVLNSLAAMLTLKTESHSEEYLVQYEILRSADSERSTGFEQIALLCQQPMDEIRFPALRLMSELASQPWGLQYVYMAAGFFEFLTNRTFDSKAALEWKFKVLQNISNNANCETILGENHFNELQTFLKQGPFYNRACAKVVTENPL